MEVKNGWIPLEGTRTEQLDLILSPLGSGHEVEAKSMLHNYEACFIGLMKHAS